MKQKELFISLRKKSSISEVFDSGQKLYSKNLLLRYKTNSDSDNPLPFHVLPAFSKRQFGAVKRNRLKRICKQAMFHAMKNKYNQLVNELSASYNLVIHARESFEGLSEKDRVIEFEDILDRLVKLT